MTAHLPNRTLHPRKLDIYLITSKILRKAVPAQAVLGSGRRLHWAGLEMVPVCPVDKINGRFSLVNVKLGGDQTG